MTDAYGELGSRPGGNHPRSSMQGGASAVPSPANNAGGGSGWGDKGFFKGGTEGSGHQNATNARSTIGGFLPLQQQKNITGSHFEQHAESANMNRSPPSGATCETEDHSFMEHKPGCSGGLPRATTAKDAVLETLHGQGR